MNQYEKITKIVNITIDICELDEAAKHLENAKSILSNKGYNFYVDRIQKILRDLANNRRYLRGEKDRMYFS